MEVRVYQVRVQLNVGGANMTIDAEVPAVPGEVEAFRTLLEGLNTLGDPIHREVRR